MHLTSRALRVHNSSGIMVPRPTMRDEKMVGKKPELDRRSPYRIQVLDRTVAVLDTLAKNGEPGLTVVEVAEAIGVAKSTAHRLLRGLAQWRFVFRQPVNDRYVLGVKLFQLGSLAAPQNHLRGRARRYLERLARETGETIHLAVLNDGQVLHLDKIESQRRLRIGIVLGSYSQASTTALGKALLACLPENRLREIIRMRGLPSRTSNSITTIAELEEELRRVRECGYALDNEEDGEGLKCVAAPVRSISGEVIAALSVAGPSLRMTDERVALLVKLVVETARGLSEEL